ncbi:MAG: efflux RND transporter permease subunit [Pseudomonadota bacterium]
MNKIYANPIRVYLFLGLLALIGLWAGGKLPVSLFPNSVRPGVSVTFSLSGYTPESFRNELGSEIESAFKKMNSSLIHVDQVNAEYSKEGNIEYRLKFSWNTSASEALKEVQNIMRGYSERFPTKMRDSVNIYNRGSERAKGFYVASLSSDQRPVEELYSLIEPILRPKLAEISDADQVSIWNPAGEKIYVKPRFADLTSLGIRFSDLETAIQTNLQPRAGGRVKIQDTNYAVNIPRSIQKADDLKDIVLPGTNGKIYRLEDVASVERKKDDNFGFRTSGRQSIIVYATPKDDGNIKRLSEDIATITRQVLSSLPSDITFTPLIDPGVFIQSAVNHVMKEVFLGAFLAVVILYLFIGSARNVITATIEIPLSLILSFILMKIFGMNLNIISLGGLALSSGMNVDASVVVLENIMRKFEGEALSQMSKERRLFLIVSAVKEVFLPLLTSTFASLVVFVPIIFTSDLTYAVLGDLAKAVVFSHVFSAVIALLLVPSVRYHLLGKAQNQKYSAENEHRAPMDKPLAKLEVFYVKILDFLIKSRFRLVSALSLAVVSLVLLVLYAVPTLPKEIVGKPDTNIIGIWFQDNSIKKPQQQDAEVTLLEKKIKDMLGDKIGFTFSQGIGVDSASILIFIQNKSDMKFVKNKLEDEFKSNDIREYNIWDWNPGELSLPKPSPLKIEMTVGSIEQRSKVLSALRSELTLKVPEFKEFNMPSDSQVSAVLQLKPKSATWAGIRAENFAKSPSDILYDVERAMTSTSAGSLSTNDSSVPIEITSALSDLKDVQEFSSLPINWQGRILPLGSLFDIDFKRSLSQSNFENGAISFALSGKIAEKNLNQKDSIVRKAKTVFDEWMKNNPWGAGAKWLESEKEIHDAIHELLIACAWSVGLIFLTMLLQFGNLYEALIVLIAIPLALIGVLLSLTIFKSSLSLNSVLGIILLNGISVANSILLVDFAKVLFLEGMAPKAAVIEASKKRLRPILITSITTILAMFPIALGMGEGGKVLQPLGIAVSGGLCISMLLTLIFVPSLHCIHLTKLNAKKSLL